jgi:two-component system, LytTR family, sensor kinase
MHAEPISGVIRLTSGRTISKRLLFHVLNFGGWGLLILVTASWEGALWGLAPAAIMDAIYGLGGVCVSFLLRAIFRYARRSQLSYVYLAVLAAAVCAVLALAWWAVDLFMDRQIFSALTRVVGGDSTFNRLLVIFADSSYLASPSGWLINTLSLFSWSMLYLLINGILDLEFERARTAQALKLADSARLRALQAQLKPHFLFNTLNGISTLIREGDGAAAATMISTLSDFLRLTLDTQDATEISVSEEVLFIERYLRIQRLRFGERLQTTLNVDPPALRARLPTLILQPLVENAVRHGVLPREGGGRVSVSIVRNGASLVASVEDDGSAAPQNVVFGVGLRNTEERLAALYGEAGRMNIGRSALGGFAVTLTMPFVAADVQERDGAYRLHPA